MKIIESNIKKLEKDTLLKYIPESTMLGFKGIEQIKKLLEPASFDDARFDWRTVAPKGGLRARLKSYCYKNHGMKLSLETLTTLGAIIKENSHTAAEHKFDFVDKMNWVSGDFGDNQSCFWKERPEIREALNKDKRIFAMRFFSKITGFLPERLTKFYDNLYKGSSRSFIWKTMLSHKPNPDLTIKTKCYVLFNAYGKHAGIQAAILSAYTKLAYKGVRITNNGEAHSGLWINPKNGGSYLIGPEEIIKNYDKLDLGVDVHEYEDRIRNLGYIFH